LLDDTLKPVLDKISLQTLLDKQKCFLKTAFGAFIDNQSEPRNLREFYKQQTHARLEEKHMETAIVHLKNVLIDLDVPEHEITKLMKELEIESIPERGHSKSLDRV
jgi:truncated hemoglobin YjbI